MRALSALAAPPNGPTILCYAFSDHHLRLTSLFEVRFVDVLGRFRCHDIELTRQRVEVLVEVGVGVELPQLGAVLRILQLQEDLVTTEKDGHLLLHQTVLAAEEHFADELDVVEHDGAAQSFELLIELQVDVLGGANENQVVGIRGQWNAAVSSVW